MRAFLLSILMIVSSTVPTITFGQDAGLKVEISASHTDIGDKQTLAIDATIRNISKEEQVLQTDMCHYGDWNWMTDNPAVRVQKPQAIPCKKNPLLYVKLQPGDVFKETVSVQLLLSVRGTGKQAFTFRLGFQPRLGYEPSTEPLSYIWSNPLKIKPFE